MPRPVLVTAGATRNPIDSMRSITANSTGKTGISIAKRLLEAHMDCTLFGSNVALLQPHCPTSKLEFFSTRDLLQKMKVWILENPTGIVIHTAAVGDFELAEADAGKIASGQSITLSLQPTPKIVDQIKTWSANLSLISFKAAAPNTTPHDLEMIAGKQCARTHSDLVFANVLGAIQTNILLYSPTEKQWFAKREDALQVLIDTVLDWG